MSILTMIAELIKKAILQRQRQQQRSHAIDALFQLRAEQKPVSKKAVRVAREKDRP